MQKKENIFSYIEKTQYGLFFAAVGVIFLISATILILVNEGFAIYEYKSAIKSPGTFFINDYKIWILRFIGLFLIFSGIKLFSSMFNIVFSFMPSLKTKLMFVRYKVTFLLALMITISLTAIPWIFFKPLSSLLLFALIVPIYYAKKKVTLNIKKILRQEFDSQEQNNPGVNDIIEGTYTEVQEKAKDKKEIIKFLIDRL
ncbi:MAG: TMEM43 family protein [Lactobacillaceae bacterium]|jgi:uncharacterized membrane protein|nr:TMEM43 family protein [Lactobacillaceae bacterium]